MDLQVFKKIVKGKKKNGQEFYVTFDKFCKALSGKRLKLKKPDAESMARVCIMRGHKGMVKLLLTRYSDMGFEDSSKNSNFLISGALQSKSKDLTMLLVVALNAVHMGIGTD